MKKMPIAKGILAVMLLLTCVVVCYVENQNSKTSISTDSVSHHIEDRDLHASGSIGSGSSTYYRSGRTGSDCILSHCDFSAKSGSNYCSRHGCCKDGCPNRKDPMVHCCDTHNCAEPHCGAHRYDYAKSKYCKTHYVHHYND